ncbi:MAG TPA: ATP-binding protein, partial [Rectinemataceae bacterium]|nr:ATP-binding protein [Rectinemataceae bacterium]
ILSTQQETSIDGILVVKDNRVISYNRQFIDLFDIPREAIDPKSDERFWQSVLAQVPNVEEFLTRVGEIDARAHETSRDEMVLKNGNVIDRYSAPLLDAERNNFGRVWYFRDITAAKQAEQVRIDLEAQLRGAQKLEAIGSLAGGVAHDFNNLLSVILSYTGFALKALSEGDPTRDDLLEVKKAAERAAALTRQLLAFSRKQVLQPLPLDLNQIAAGIEKMLRRILGEDIDLVQALAPDLGLVMADPGQIEQVLMNLVVNARDAMPEGGKLTIETCNIDLDDAYAAHHEAVEPGPYVMLAISDSGQGMDEGTKARIFEPFFTTKPRGKGTGLGLSTVYGIVKQSGGDIWVYSELGQGTTFKIYLPRDASARTAAVKEAAIAPANSIKSGTILVVEDEEALRKVTKRTLDDAGYTVLSAANGEEALKASARHAGEIRLLLTDVVMPRMGGRLLAQELLKTRPETEVIYMSGYTDNAIVHHGVLDVGTNFLGKPFTAEALLEKVNAVLGGEASQPAEARGLTAKVPEEREEPALDREALRSLPPGTLARLRTAVVAARYDEITGLLAAIRGANPELAAELQRMADLFDLQGMRDILD